MKVADGLGGFGLAHGVGFGLKWEPSPSKLMEVNVFSINGL